MGMRVTWRILIHSQPWIACRRLGMHRDRLQSLGLFAPITVEASRFRNVGGLGLR